MYAGLSSLIREPRPANRGGNFETVSRGRIRCKRQSSVISEKRREDLSSSERNIARGGLSFDLSTLFEKEKTEEGKRFTL